MIAILKEVNANGRLPKSFSLEVSQLFGPNKCADDLMGNEAYALCCESCCCGAYPSTVIFFHGVSHQVRLFLKECGNMINIYINQDIFTLSITHFNEDEDTEDNVVRWNFRRALSYCESECERYWDSHWCATEHPYLRDYR